MSALRSCVKLFDSLGWFHWAAKLLALYILEYLHLRFISSTVGVCFVNIFRSVREVSKSDYQLQHVCPSVSLSVLPRGTTRLPAEVFLLIFIFENFSNFIQKIQVSLKSDKNSGTLHDDLRTIYDNISLNSSYNKKRFRQICIQNQNRKKKLFFPENRPVCEIMWENMIENDMPPMIIKCDTRDLHAGWIRLQTPTQNVCYLFHLTDSSGATRTRPQCSAIRTLAVLLLAYLLCKLLSRFDVVCTVRHIAVC